MKLQRYDVWGSGLNDRDPNDHGEWCDTDDVSTLESENAALHAECDRLTAILQWEQNRRDHIGTHGDDCWKWGPAHYECALREIERLTAMLWPQKPMSAEEVTEPGFYWQRPSILARFEPVWVIKPKASSLGLCMVLLGDDTSEIPLTGQFIGPIKMPEV